MAERQHIGCLQTWPENKLCLLELELGNWYSCGTQIFSFVSHLLWYFFLEVENTDSEGRSFD